MSKFERGDNFKLTEKEKELRDRLVKEVQKKGELHDKDAQFAAMVQDEDELSFFESNYDFDGKGNFMKGQDGFSLGEGVDYHDLDGKPTHNGPFKRIIGKTSPKTEIFSDDKWDTQNEKTIMEKVQTQLLYLQRTMHLDQYELKHWFYRLRREYIKEAKIKKRLEKRKAKK